jgi:hypothetical protein
VRNKKKRIARDNEENVKNNTENHGREKQVKLKKFSIRDERETDESCIIESWKIEREIR